MVLHFLLTKSFFDFFTDMSAVFMIFKLEVFLLHFFVFGLHTEIVLNCFFQGIQQLIKCFGTITKEVCLHIDITSMRFIVFVQIKLVKQSRLVLVQDIPGDTGIIRDQHFALHKQFIYRCVTERFQVNTVLQCGKILYVPGKSRADKSLHADHIFPEDL